MQPKSDLRHISGNRWHWLGKERRCERLKIWPDEIEGGDTERDGKTYATMRFIDYDAETAVVVFLQRETERG